MKCKIKDARLSFATIRTPNVSDPDEDGKVKRSYSLTLIASDDTVVEYEEENAAGDKVKVTIPHADFVEKFIPHVWAEKGLKPPKVPYLNYGHAKASDTVGLRGPKISAITGEYYEGYTKDTMYFFGKVDADRNPNPPLIVGPKLNILAPSDGHPNSGDFVNVALSYYVFGKPGKQGISASYSAIQYLRPGEGFGASVASPTIFDEEEEVGETVDENF
jgi:hypothetical protein